MVASAASDLARKIDQDMNASIARYLDFLRIPSISTDPAFKGDVRRAAEWAASQLRELGFTATIHDTPLHPIVIATYEGPTDAPRLLYYGHYDVQPADPLDLWKSPPFEPVIVEGPRGPRVVARGAVDDKGQVMTFIEAFRVWKAATGRLPASITVLLEGEEECGSPSLGAFLEQHAAGLKNNDIVIVTDTTSWDINTPAITYRLRGLVYVEATIEGPSHDLHSGRYGGAVPNPINVLTRILGQLHDADGRVQIPGFYDDVLELTPAELQGWRDLGFNESEFMADIGLRQSVGEKGRSVLERVWGRPTCDINGIYGGYIGAGHKTVIGSKASAKVSCRLVPNQDPKKIRAGLQRFFEERLPADCKLTMEDFGGSPGVRVPMEGIFMQAVCKGLRDVYGKDPAMIGSGGSIPVVGLMREKLGLDSILVGFGLDDDLIHSPNEKFELKCFENGIKSHAAMLGYLAEVRAAR